MFAEISTELAAELKINNGDIFVLSLARAIEARRLSVAGFGHCISMGNVAPGCGTLSFWNGRLGGGGAANDLLTISGEPNVTIMEAKACTCNIVPAVCHLDRVR